MKLSLKNAKPGLWLALAASAIALVGAVAYLIIYQVTADPDVDRVFSWLTFGLTLAGGVIGLAGELLDLSFTPILSGGCFAVALGAHLTETAYPLADVITGVPFFGGNATLAIAFAVVFGVAALLNIVSSFMTHRT